MWWLLGQVWLLCAAAFLLGSLVTWLAVGRPRRARSAPAHPRRDFVMPPPSWATGGHRAVDDPQRDAAPPTQARAADSALAALDTGSWRLPTTGTAATGALDMLGVARTGGWRVPAQAGGSGHRAVPAQAGQDAAAAAGSGAGAASGAWTAAGPPPGSLPRQEPPPHAGPGVPMPSRRQAEPGNGTDGTGRAGRPGAVDEPGGTPAH